MASPLAEHLEAISRQVLDASLVLVCFDFDGTLTQIQDQPETVSLDPFVRRSLADLSQNERVSVAIISGRSLADLRERVGLDGVAYGGNHGLEIETPFGSFRHPAAIASRQELAKLVESLRQELAPFSGVWVEDKGLTASVHFRLAAHSQIAQVVAHVDQVVRMAANAGTFLVRSGNSVREIRPATEWNKGSAVQWLAEQFPPTTSPPLIFYFGDDETDEDAFHVLRDGGMGISVGDRLTEAAKYIVQDQSSVHRFMVWLLGVLSRSSKTAGTF